MSQCKIVSNESENSDSEFFYLGELSFTKLLQSQTYSKTERRKKDNTPQMNAEVHKFI